MSKPMSHTSLIPVGRIDRSILFLRQHRVIIDADLADLYGVTTKRLNEQIKRNRERFPGDFMFQLTSSEKAEVVANCDHLARLRFSPVLPRVFTEHGAIMAANVLSSKRAVQMSVYVVRAFVRLRQLLSTHEEFARKLAALEAKYDKQFQGVFEAIKRLMAEPESKRQPIGFRVGSEG